MWTSLAIWLKNLKGIDEALTTSQQQCRTKGCGHGKKYHGWNRDARERIDACEYRKASKNNIIHPCGCEGFRE